MMMNSKRWLAYACCALLSIGAFSSCGTDSPKVKLDPKKPVTLNIWHYYNGAQKNAFDQLITEFNDTVGLEKGIVIEGFNQGNVSQLIENVLASAEGRVGTDPIPDIYAAYADTAYQVDQLGLVADLTPYLTKEELAAFNPSYLDEGRLSSEEELKIFPTAKSTEVLMLNKTDWEPFSKATGASTAELATIEGVVRTAEAYYNWTDGQTPDIPFDGKAFFGRDAMANYFIIGCKQLGADIFSVKDGKVTFQLDETIMKRLWDGYYVPFIKGYFAANGRFRSDDAKVGDILALVGSTSSATYFPMEINKDGEAPYPVEALVFSAPVFEGGENYYVQQGAGMVVTKSTPQKEFASVEFLKWFTEAERNLRFSMLSGYLPVKTEAMETERLNTAFQNIPEGDMTENLRGTISVAINAIRSGSLYTNRAFSGGTDARNVLEYSLSDKAQADAEAVRKLIDGGQTLEEASSAYNTEENFKAFLDSLLQALADTQKGS